MLNFVKGFFWDYWKLCDFYPFPFVHVVFHINWLANVISSLWPWNKSNSIVVYDPFYIVEFSLLIYCSEFLHLCSSNTYIFICSTFIFFRFDSMYLYPQKPTPITSFVLNYLVYFPLSYTLPLINASSWP